MGRAAYPAVRPGRWGRRGARQTPPGARAHDIPDEIVLQGFVKPEGTRLQLLIRLPLTLLVDMDLPKRGPGFLDLKTIDDELESAADATARQVLLYQGNRVLEPSNAAFRLSLPSDKAFASYATALAHIHGPALATETEVFWNQVTLTFT